MPKSNSSISLERRLMAYPSQKYYKMFSAYCRIKFRTKAGMLSDFIREYFDKMSEHEQSMLLKKFDKMSAEEIKYPHK